MHVSGLGTQTGHMHFRSGTACYSSWNNDHNHCSSQRLASQPLFSQGLRQLPQPLFQSRQPPQPLFRLRTATATTDTVEDWAVATIVPVDTTTITATVPVGEQTTRNHCSRREPSTRSHCSESGLQATNTVPFRTDGTTAAAVSVVTAITAADCRSRLRQRTQILLLFQSRPRRGTAAISSVTTSPQPLFQSRLRRQYCSSRHYECGTLEPVGLEPAMRILFQPRPQPLFQSRDYDNDHRYCSNHDHSHCPSQRQRQRPLPLSQSRQRQRPQILFRSGLRQRPATVPVRDSYHSHCSSRDSDHSPVLVETATTATIPVETATTATSFQSRQRPTTVPVETATTATVPVRTP